MFNCVVFLYCFCQLLYVDSLDITGLDIDLPRGRYAVTIWSKKNLETALKADLQLDGKTYGKLEVTSVSSNA